MAKPHNTHPNSIAALKKHAAPLFTTESARKGQLAGAAARKKNNEMRKQAAEVLKGVSSEWKTYSKEIQEGPSAVDVLRIMMLNKIEEGDHDTAIDIAKSIAEFETPKLARQENTNVELGADDLSDDELDAKLQEFFKGK